MTKGFLQPNAFYVKRGLAATGTAFFLSARRGGRLDLESEFPMHFARK
jgi:hypothetical protein